MRYILNAFIIGSIIVSAGCSSSDKKPSPLDPYWNDKGNTIAYKKFTTPKKWAAGQFVVAGQLDKGKKEGVSKTTIVRKEKTAWVFEVINIDKKGKTTGMQMCIEGMDLIKSKNDIDKLNILWIKVLDDKGEVQLIDGSMMNFFKTIYKSQLEQFAVSDYTFAEGGPVTVPAGTFKGTTVVKGGASSSMLKKTYTSFFHPDVPVNGMVKAEDEKGNVIMELLDFGSNGKAVIE